MSLIASLPMYDLPEVRKETDALWRLLADHMRREGVRNVPNALTREGSCEQVWRRPDLLLTQTCGFPLTHDFRKILRPVVTPIYETGGCCGADYSSAVLVAQDSKIESVDGLSGKICAFNSRMSQSGYNALKALVAPLAPGDSFFAGVEETGGHRASITAVSSGSADVCAVDCVTYALLSRYAPESIEGTRVLTFTAGCPGLPMATRADLDADQFKRLRSAVVAAMSDPLGSEVRQALFIGGAVEANIEDYRPVLEMEASAAAAGLTDFP